MLLKKLSFNRTLFRKNLSRFWPLWGLTSLGGALFPLALLLELLRSDGYMSENGVLEMNDIYFEAVQYALPLLSLFYAILVAIAVWSYLYNHRSVTMMHTLPIRRESLYLTNVLSGMAMLLIPYVVVGVLMVCITLAFGLFDLGALAVTVAAVIGESFFYFASATFVAFIVSNGFALPAVYFLLHFLAAILDWLVCTFSTGFIFGLSGSYSGTVEFLSPTVYLLNKVRVDRSYEEFARWTESSKTYYDSVLVDVALKNGWLIAVYAFVGVVLLGLGWLLYRRHASESAGDVISVAWLRPVFRCGLAALCALLGGLVLYEIFWGSFQNGRYYDTVPMMVFMVFAGLVGYYATAMLLEKSFRVFRSGWKGGLLVMVGCIALCAILRFDAFGVSRKVPAIDQVERVTFRAADNDYVFYPGEEDALLEQVRAIHQSIVDDADYARKMGDGVWFVMGSEELEGNYVRKTVQFDYELKNGRRVERYYYLAINRDRLNRPDTYEYLLDKLVNSGEMRRKRLHDGDPRYTPDGGYLYLEKGNEDYEFSSRESAAVLEALGRDAQEGTWGTYRWFNDTDAFDYAMNLELEFSYRSHDGEDTYHDWISIRVRSDMTHTVACLQEMGYLTEANMITRMELYPESYKGEEPYYYEKYGMDAPVAVSMTAG